MNTEIIILVVLAVVFGFFIFKVLKKDKPAPRGENTGTTYTDENSGSGSSGFN